MDGVKVEFTNAKGEKETDHAQLVDFQNPKNNDFLGQFALAEGKKGGQYLTPKSIVSLIVEMLEPYQGRVYDPAIGSWLGPNLI